MTQLNRRQIVQSSLLIGLSTTAVSNILSTALAKESKGLASGSRILFQGDSITDAGRDRKAEGANNSGGLGRGYPFLAAGEMLRDHAELKLEIFNRGISGNKVPDLAARWQTDCIELKPTVLSNLIGLMTSGTN